MQRRRIIRAAGGAVAAVGLPSFLVAPAARAQAVEKPRLTLAVGGKNLLYYRRGEIDLRAGEFRRRNRRWSASRRRSSSTRTSS